MEKKTVAVLGMMCSACAANVEKRLKQIEGVRLASVNLASRTVFVEYDAATTSLPAMKQELSAIGYDMVIEDDRNVEAMERSAFTSLRRKVVLSWFFAVAVMAVCMHWVKMPAAYSAQAAFILAAACLTFCGRQFFVSAWRQLTHATANMDTLVALSTGVSFLYSTFITFGSSLDADAHTYFDATVMVITFVLTGRLLEEKAKQGTASSIRSLMKLQPQTAHLAGADGSVTDIPITAVQPGDVLAVSPGEKIPVDGVVRGCSGTVLIDESMMTGEALPAEKVKGDKLLAGTIVSTSASVTGHVLTMTAQEVGEKTVLANMIRTVQEAQGSKAPVQRVVDRVAMVFVPTVTVLSVLTFVLWLVIGGHDMLPQALVSAVSVLVIACPCAMGLATPTALMVGIGKAAQNSILIKDATALEELRSVDALVIDKTGTLTQTIDGQESLKPHAREAISELKDMGIDIYMMSGDTEERVSRWASEAGIAHYRAKVLPGDKEALVKQLKAEGRKVAMAGDGINDSQALATADVSIAMATGTDVAMNVAQVTLMTSDLRKIPQAIALSRATVSMIRQNLFWAFIYNIICIPLAAGLPLAVGLQWHITPALASALMALSSVSVVLNSLRLKGVKS